MDGESNVLINYNPVALAAAAQEINPYIPVLSVIPADQIHDQVLSVAVGPETSYAPKPMLAETIDHQTADRIRRGLRKETVTHQIAQGETLGKIASYYGVNVATLLEANKLGPTDTLKIKPGMELSIPPENTTESVAWLDTLHEEERKERELRERERQTRLAQQSKVRNTRVANVARAADSETVRLAPGNFRQPMGSGPRYNGYHWWATDHPAAPGVPIGASAGGTVVAADPNGYNGGYGKTILIDHGNGWQTRYAHMSQLYVSPGERVDAGQTIGANGNTGRSTGPHLHFEIIRNGQRLNPCNYIGC